MARFPGTALLCFLLFSILSAQNRPAQELPEGTVIPVVLKTNLQTGKTQSDTSIQAETMQDVTIPGSMSWPRGSHLAGHIVSVSSAASGSEVVLKFDTLRHDRRVTPVSVRVLAIASMMEVFHATTPTNSTANRDPENEWVTRQVGGDLVRRGQGKVFSRAGITGVWLQGSSVRVRPVPNPAAGCPEGPGYEADQALWIFSAGACGTYGLDGVVIDTDSRHHKAGEIILRSKKGIRVRSGSGWLLIVSSPART